MAVAATPGRQDGRTPGRQDARMPGRQDARTAGRQDGRSPGRQDANTARPGRTGRPPERTRVYKMTKMSEFRRPAPSMLDHVGVRGMLDIDIPGVDESRVREAAAPPSETYGKLETGLLNPDQISSRQTTSTCVGRVLIGVKEPCRNSGLDEAVTAELVGQMAIDLSAKIGGDFPI